MLHAFPGIAGPSRPRAAFAALIWLLTLGAHAQTAAPDKDTSRQIERSRQQSIYHGRGELRPEGYVIDRGLSAYRDILAPGFDASLNALTPNERWLDIGAGQGYAILDYYATELAGLQPGAKPAPTRKARSVAMSIEDRSTERWKDSRDRLAPGQIRYVHGKSLREYTTDDLGRFQLVTDVIGGFSYTENLGQFMEKVLGLMTTGATFYTVHQDVRWESGGNKPFYEGAPFLTQVLDAAGSDIGICAWLRRIGCVQVACDSKTNWRPPVESYSIRKTCDQVTVPPLDTEKYVAGTPPERIFRLQPAKPAPAAAQP